VRDFKDNKSKFFMEIGAAAQAGYQYIRIARLLGESDTSGYFTGRHIGRGDMDHVVGAIAAIKALGMRVQLTHGHQWPEGAQARLAWETQLFEKIQAAGLANAIFLFEGDNEFWQNATWHDSPEQIALYGLIFEAGRRILNPAPFFACGAPADESPDNVFQSATHSDVCEIHTSRDVDKMVKRVFGLWYWEGQPGFFPKPYVHGEPTPPPHKDAFMGHDSPGRLLAAYAMAQLTGGALTQFSGQSVRGYESITQAPGFFEIPKLLAHIPDDIATWGHVPGGQIWWWQGPGKQFATVVDEQWGNVYAPPKPINFWKIIGPSWGITEGTGLLKPPPNFGGFLAIGEFV
jgi:hypothetical protein